MRLISELHIKGFRSLRSIELKNILDFTAFVGLNNSGKSNVLRALNVFFNGESDPGQRLDVDADYYRPDLRRKKAKRISIAVRFSLPSHFKFRMGLEPVEQLLTSRDFLITKEWRRDSPDAHYFLNGHKQDQNARLKLDQFLQLINFRYIPNRVQPIDVVRKEHQALRDVLVRRLARTKKEHDKTFDAIRRSSDGLIKALVKRVSEALPDVTDIRLATPSSWADIVFNFGYRLGKGEVEMDDSVQGSGVQSLLMLETLYLIDRDYFQRFGWRQASIWAVEEPESSLHTSLEARISAYLSMVASEPSSRLQVVCTTHSDLIVQYASQTVIAKKDGWQTACEIIADPRESLKRLSSAGVSRWVHPILHFPLDPLILVEGKHDFAFWVEVLRQFRTIRKVNITYLEMLETSGSTGGISDILKYVKNNSAAIKSRPHDSPVTVVIDWDAASKVVEFRKPFGQNDPFHVLLWPAEECNPTLNKTFRGIERFFSDRMVDEAERSGAVIYRSAEGICSVEKDNYSPTKDILQEVVKRGLTTDDLKYSRSFIEVVLKKAGAIF